jgi:hypothetical protein
MIQPGEVFWFSLAVCTEHLFSGKRVAETEPS